MSTTGTPDDLGAVTRTSQIIVAALIMCVILFLAVVLMVIRPMAGGVNGLPPNLITYIALAVAAANLALSFSIPGMVAANGRRRIAREIPAKTTDADRPARLVDASSDTPRLAILYQTQLIVGAAFLEGAALFNGIAYILERPPIALAAVVVLLGLLASRMPTRDRVDSWIDAQSVALQEDRQGLP
ncbi:hypothetical protein OJF2_70330 [Aquisphaera giovannonii]|uniref:Uncharacterized protein n=1 Tax=Aquisphaera giovannonii TaxID=406548 RepID=A0A5B9WCY1_9BACT|nr:hypothetical protein [Aquisphaera giovannonii]QEH38432.1 hypothetical protein OJF2_70330 [Aquisphaera giovannonii]